MSANASPRAVAYIVDRFPSCSETFIVREIVALGRNHVSVHVFALRRGEDEVVHEDSARLLPSVIFAPAPWGLRAAVALGYFLVCNPRRLLWCLLPALLAVIGGSPRDGVWLIRALIAAAAFAHSRQGEVARVHAHFAHRPADVARMFALLQGVPWSVSVHAWDVFAQAPTALRRRIAGSERIFACTRVAQEHLTRLLPEITARFALMYHGIDATQLPPESCPGEVVLAVGRLERKKGFDLLVEAARILRDAGDLISVVIVGDGPERGALEGAIARHALEGQVALVGSRSQASLMRFYAQAAVVVVPSRQLGSGDRDGLPNVILEALGSARPVVATAVGGIPEVVVDGRNGFLVPPDDPAALADAIRHILTNRDDARRLGLAGAALVRSDFDSRRTVRTLCEYFEGDVHPTSA